MDTLLKLVQTANAYLSDYILIVMLVGCGLYYSPHPLCPGALPG